VYIVWSADDPVRPLYVGVAATPTIEQPWRGQHLINRAGSSALRRSLGVYLRLVERKLSVKREGRYYPTEVEKAITRFLRSCEVECRVASGPDEAREFERELIDELRPRLNVRQRSRVFRTPSERAVLREAKALYEERVKPALLAALLRSIPTASLDGATGYARHVQDNLLPGISLAEVEGDFAGAPGHELESKIRAPWSSSALAVNSFAPWRHDAGFFRAPGRHIQPCSPVCTARRPRTRTLSS
jgi:hypothetical protein